MKTDAYDWSPPPIGIFDLGNDICGMIDDIIAEARRLGLFEGEANHGEA